MSDETIGPILYSRGVDEAGHRVAVLLLVPDGATPPALEPDGAAAVAAEPLDCLLGWRAFGWRFTLPPDAAGYALGGRFHPVAADLGGDARVGFVSCNGKERGDFDRPQAERNAMWRRLAEHHARAPLGLLIHGGDQIYADGALEAHPDLAAWRDMPPRRAGEVQATPEMELAATRFFFDCWRRSVTAPAVATLLSQVPSAMMWDDHDIMDGWGSLAAIKQEGPVGQMIFAVARRFFRLFQAGGLVCADAETLSAAQAYPGFRVLLPDLRSERRRDRVMGPAGWDFLQKAFDTAPAGDHVFLMSSVPALGPRLSLIEGLHRLVPGAQKYEDDLRDQWQSRAHRQEWRRFLGLMADHMEAAGPVTVLSGEIHLATRGEMRLSGGRILHQLCASGVSHPPAPQAFARALGWLAAVGDQPLPDRPIRLLAPPGMRAIYVAERNVLILSRIGGRWSAQWDFEESGLSPALAL